MLDVRLCTQAGCRLTTRRESVGGVHCAPVQVKKSAQTNGDPRIPMGVGLSYPKKL